MIVKISVVRETMLRGTIREKRNIAVVESVLSDDAKMAEMRHDIYDAILRDTRALLLDDVCMNISAVSSLYSHERIIALAFEPDGEIVARQIKWFAPKTRTQWRIKVELE